MANKAHTSQEAPTYRSGSSSRFETFSKYSKSTFTAIFKYKESEFVFVPGDTVTLGYEGLPKNLSDETLKGLKYCLDETEDLDTVLGEYIRENFRNLEKPL